MRSASYRKDSAQLSRLRDLNQRSRLHHVPFSEAFDPCRGAIVFDRSVISVNGCPGSIASVLVDSKRTNKETWISDYCSAPRQEGKYLNRRRFY